VDPSESRLRVHVEQAPFQIGAAEGRWKIVPTNGEAWPFVVFQVSAAHRSGAPDHYHVRLELSAYPIDPPTGTFWDLAARQPLPIALRPFGSGQVGRVFRVDWKGGQAFYHPYDRQASRDHGDWPRQYPHWVWTEKHTVVDLLSVISELLASSEYEGVRGGR
jgi:hypothetical protein